MKIAKNLAENLRSRRGNLSQEAFSRKVGVARANITRIENCSQNVTIKTIERIAKALKCDAWELLAPPSKKE